MRARKLPSLAVILILVIASSCEWNRVSVEYKIETKVYRYVPVSISGKVELEK